MKNIIEERRTLLDMSVTTLSKLIGTTEEEILLWESGKKEPSIPEIIRLSQIFNITVDEFVEALADKSQLAQEPVVDQNLDDEKEESLVFLPGTYKLQSVDKTIIIFFVIFLILSLPFFIRILFGQSSNCKLKNPFSEEVVDLRYVVAGEYPFGEEIVIGPLAHGWNDYESNSSFFYLVEEDYTYTCDLNKDTSANIQVLFDKYVMGEEQYKYWFVFNNDEQAVYVKGKIRLYSNAYSVYIQASEIRAAK